MDHALVEKVAAAICAERCAFYGEPPCWKIEGEWPPKSCDEPGCVALAQAAIAAMSTPGPGDTP